MINGAYTIQYNTCQTWLMNILRIWLGCFVIGSLASSLRLLRWLSGFMSVKKKKIKPILHRTVADHSDHSNKSRVHCSMLQEDDDPGISPRYHHVFLEPKMYSWWWMSLALGTAESCFSFYSLCPNSKIFLLVVNLIVAFYAPHK